LSSVSSILLVHTERLLTESIGVILSEETPAAGNLRKLDEAAVAEAATVSQKMPSYGDYVEFSSNDSICPAGFSVPTEGEFAAETTLFVKGEVTSP
jgi:hypothetical protein